MTLIDKLRVFSQVATLVSDWQPENLRLRVIGRLKTLTRLDGTLVTDAEIASSLRVTATARISQLALLTYCRTDERRPQTMDLDTSVHCLSEHSRNRPVRSVITDNSWLAEVLAHRPSQQTLTLQSSPPSSQQTLTLQSSPPHHNRHSHCSPHSLITAATGPYAA